MKNLRSLFFCLSAGLMLILPGFCSADTVSSSPYPSPLRIGIVDFKTCLEQSKIGKQEQGSFEAMKKQMEAVLEEKGKVIEDLDAKAKDPDYLDSLSPEAETDFNRKLRGMKQEAMALQNQYLQTLNQANFKIIQKLNGLIEKASKIVAEQMHLHLILNDEGAFFFSPALDISLPVAAKMDEIAENENALPNP